MMKNTTLFIVIICLFTMFKSKTIAQEHNVENVQIKIKATIIAFDGFVNASNMTFAPQQQIFIVKVAKILQGNEEAKYIKIIYEYFRTDDKFLADLISNKEHSWKFLLSRSPGCDSTLKQSKYAKVKLIDGKVIGTQLKLKDLGGLDKISEDTKLPCYVLETDGIINMVNRP